MLTLNATALTIAGSATGNATQEFAAIINRKLCRAVCINQQVQPTPYVTYSVESQETIGANTFVRIRATGTISYVPKGGCECSTITQSFTEYTTIVFTNASATSAPTVSLVQNNTDGYLTDINCMTGKSYEMATDIIVTAAY